MAASDGRRVYRRRRLLGRDQRRPDPRAAPGCSIAAAGRRCRAPGRARGRRRGDRARPAVRRRRRRRHTASRRGRSSSTSRRAAGRRRRGRHRESTSPYRGQRARVRPWRAARGAGHECRQPCSPSLRGHARGSLCRRFPAPAAAPGPPSSGGRIVSVGGEEPAGTIASVYAYDLATRRWARLADLPTPRHGLGVVALGGRVYAVGGGPQPGLYVSDANESIAPAALTRRERTAQEREQVAAASRPRRRRSLQPRSAIAATSAG